MLFEPDLSEARKLYEFMGYFNYSIESEVAKASFFAFEFWETFIAFLLLSTALKEEAKSRVTISKSFLRATFRDFIHPCILGSLELSKPAMKLDSARNLDFLFESFLLYI